MTSNNHQGPVGPNNSDLPEFDPDEVDAFSNAIAVINKGEALKKIIMDAAHRGDIYLIPANVPLDSELISAVHRLSPGSTLTQIRKEICDYVNPLIFQALQKLDVLSFVKEGIEQQLNQEDMREAEFERKREQRMSYLDIGSRLLIAIVAAFLMLVSGFAIFQSIRTPTPGCNTPDCEELRNFGD